MHDNNLLHGTFNQLSNDWQLEPVVPLRAEVDDVVSSKRLLVAVSRIVVQEYSAALSVSSRHFKDNRVASFDDARRRPNFHKAVIKRVGLEQRNILGLVVAVR